MEELIFSVEAHSSKELRHFKFLCVSFMAQLLGSTSFIGKVSDKPTNERQRSVFNLQKTLKQHQRSSSAVTANAEKTFM